MNWTLVLIFWLVGAAIIYFIIKLAQKENVKSNK